MNATITGIGFVAQQRESKLEFFLNFMLITFSFQNTVESWDVDSGHRTSGDADVSSAKKLPVGVECTAN